MRLLTLETATHALPVVEFVDELGFDAGSDRFRKGQHVCRQEKRHYFRFGETIKAYVQKFGDASRLTAIPLGIAGWLRYMLGVDDEGNKFELAPDPMNEELQEQFKDIVVGKPETFKDQLKPILSNERLFFTDLYKDGVGEKVEDMFREMIAGPGAVRATIHKYVG